MKAATALITCFIALSLWSCSRVQDEFVVRDPKSVVRSAELMMYGKRRQLVKSNGQYSIMFPIKYDANGVILVRMEDGSTIKCTIGYVAPGTESYWEYEIINGKCLSTQYRPRNPNKKHNIFNQFYEWF
jgi:hypothetical protein